MAVNESNEKPGSQHQTREKDAFQPFIPAHRVIPELTPLPLFLGVVLGMIFGASSLYLVLKVGLTVSASIPVAVISITLFKIFSKFGIRRATILENNIVQTAGSAGESIAFGIGVTMPAILILGFDLEISRVMLVAILGGLLGILMMIPLRRALIVKQHRQLKYPEGTACAEVLKAGTADQTDNANKSDYKGAHTIFIGFGIGLVYKILMSALKCWKEIPEKVFGIAYKGGSISAEISPELLGVGYIIGPRLGAIMCGGGVLAYLVLIPAIKFFGEGLTAPLAPGLIPIKEMSPNDIRSAYILYIGAGAVAAGGIISMIRSLPIILHGIKEGLNMVKSTKSGGEKPLRTEHDLSLRVVFGGIVALIIAIMLSKPLHMNLAGAVLIIIFGFLFSTVSSRLTGEIGSSSNPISGMTVATLLLTCLIFLMLGWTDPVYQVTALSVGGIVCIAASNAGTTSQDLKTGFLVGATPRYQQIAILVGAFFSALILGPILLKLNQTGTVYVPQYTYETIEPSTKLEQPQKIGALSPFTNAPALWKNPPFNLLKISDEYTVSPQIKLKPGSYILNANGEVIYKIRQNFSDSLKAPKDLLNKKEKLQGPQFDYDKNEYYVWHKTDSEGGPAGKYLVDKDGKPVYYVDPGINGTHTTRPDGSVVTKFDAPKATLMSYIIKGILSRELPWGLVIIGVMIAVVLELASVPSLAFAVGVYLPLSSSMPIFIGGMVRWLVDHYLAAKKENREKTSEQLSAESDRSPGVLMASGYIAGGAIAGICIAFLVGVFGDAARKIEEWSSAHNPLYTGQYADLLSLLPFFILAAILYLSGRGLLFSNSDKSSENYLG
ncbi:MAG: OPT family oligopeptide transporter [Verrucomicrobiia bacterium]